MTAALVTPPTPGAVASRSELSNVNNCVSLHHLSTRAPEARHTVILCEANPLILHADCGSLKGGVQASGPAEQLVLGFNGMLFL